MLLIVDPQVDFINGTLPVLGAQEAMDSLARYVKECGKEYECIIVTCDRHPIGHSSFREFGGEWPRHCIESSVGAAVWPVLMERLIPLADRVSFLYKGEATATDEYSIFQSAEGARRMRGFLKDGKIAELDICGLAGDVCVKTTLEDAIRLYPGIQYRILEEYTASLDGGECMRSMAKTLANFQA